MNILILAPEEIGARIVRGDRRWAHVKKVLKKAPGDRIAAGIASTADGIARAADGTADGALGEAVIRELDGEGMVLDFEAYPGPRGVPSALAALTLVLGFPRPIQAARILKDLTSLGVSEIHLTGTELGEKSYAQSSFFKERDFRASLIEGAEQAGNPRLPRVFTHWSLRLCLQALAADPAPGGKPGQAHPPMDKLFLHPYGGYERLGATTLSPPLTLAIGSERGWTDSELLALEAAGFAGRSLGGRILKTETAAIAACVLALAGFQLL